MGLFLRDRRGGFRRIPLCLPQSLMPRRGALISAPRAGRTGTAATLRAPVPARSLSLRQDFACGDLIDLPGAFRPKTRVGRSGRVLGEDAWPSGLDIGYTVGLERRLRQPPIEIGEQIMKKLILASAVLFALAGCHKAPKPSTSQSGAQPAPAASSPSTASGTATTTKPSSSATGGSAAPSSTKSSGGMSSMSGMSSSTTKKKSASGQ